MRLIDADALIEALRAKEHETVKHPTFLRSEFEEGFSRGINIAKEIIIVAPTIEAEPVRRGKWIDLHYGNYKCSICGSWWRGEEREVGEAFNSCPNCGARMEVEND